MMVVLRLRSYMVHMCLVSQRTSYMSQRTRVLMLRVPLSYIYCTGHCMSHPCPYAGALQVDPTNWRAIDRIFQKSNSVFEKPEWEKRLKPV
jgi:hypothetical protein